MGMTPYICAALLVILSLFQTGIDSSAESPLSGRIDDETDDRCVSFENDGEVDDEFCLPQSPLTDAFLDGGISAAEAAIASGERLDPKSRAARLLLRIFSREGDRSAVRWLLEKGVDPDGPVHGDAFRCDAEVEWTACEDVSDEACGCERVVVEIERPMHLAAKGGDIAMLKLLIEHGASFNAAVDSNAVGPPLAWTPLAAAIFSGQVATVRYLLDRGARFHATGFRRFSSLIPAIWWNRPEVVAALVQRGANVNAADPFGETPLHYLAERHLSDCCDDEVCGEEYEYRDEDDETCEPLELDLFVKARLHLRAKDGQTALHRAARFGDAVLVRWLLKSGARPELTDQHKQTPLHLAAVDGDPQTIKALLEKMRQLDAKDADGHTALELAEKHGHAFAASLLIRAGASSQTADDD